MRIQFNTKRRYTVHGQRIVARWENGKVYFYDNDRMIAGEFGLIEEVVNELFTREYVMMRYDAGEYHMSCRAMAEDMRWVG